MKPPRLLAELSRLRRSRGGVRGGALRALEQVRESALEPLPVLLAASAAAGAAVILALTALMKTNAIGPYLNTVISFAITSVLAPILAALILALRSGAAVAVAVASDRMPAGTAAGAETGTGTDTDVGTGTDTGANPTNMGSGEGQGSDLVPRAVGLVLSAILLTAFMAVAALAGGFLLVQVLGRAPESVRLGSLVHAISPAGAAAALGKAALAGLAIAILSVVHGTRAAASSAEAPDRPATPIAKAAGNAALQGALASVAILVALAPLGAGSGSASTADNNEFIINAVSTDGFGTRVGASVKVRGIEVGSITDIALVHDPARPDRPVRITIRIDRHAASFLSDRTVAHIERIQMGNGVPPFAVPEIELRTDGDSPLLSGSTVEAVGDATMAESFVQLSHDVAAVRALIDGLGEPLKDLGTITRALARTDGAAGRFINDPATAEEMTAMLDGARGATASLQKVLADARALSQQAGPLLTEMQGASKDGRDALAGAAMAARDLPRVLKAAERTLKIAEELVVNLRAASVYAPELARKVDASLEETNRVVDAAQRSLILRNTVPDRQTPRTEEEVRPPAPIQRSEEPE